MVEPSYQRETSGNADTRRGNSFDNIEADPLAQLDNLDNITVDDLLSLGTPQGDDNPDSFGVGESSSSPELWRVHHPGVHMQLQENSKLPTFNLPVNRSAVRDRAKSIDSNTSSSNINSNSLRGSASSQQGTTFFGSSAQRQSEGFAKRPPALPKPPDPSRLGEHFLNHSTRHQRITFHRHALPEDTTTAPISVGSTSSVSGNAVDPLDALLAADLKDINPTPLSEIRMRHEAYQQKLRNTPPPISQISTKSNTASTDSRQDQAEEKPQSSSETVANNPSEQQQSQARTQQQVQITFRQPAPQNYPNQPPHQQGGPYVGAYSVRPVPLPIPTKKISPPGSPPSLGQTPKVQLAQKLNMPRQTQPTNTGQVSQSVPIATSQNNTKDHSNSNSSGMNSAASSTTMNSKLPQQSHHQQKTNATMKKSLNGSASTHTTYNNSAPAIHRASTQKTQYGFGTNHVVASVPPLVAPTRNKRVTPPSSITTKSTAYAPRTANAASMAAKFQQQQQAARVAAAQAREAEAGVGNNQGAAYERKKQRAKDARVRLNESIERLSVAIGLAGTQSRERSDQWNSLPAVGAGRQASLDICQECVVTAEAAKKWDRPSFVGSAASLIQALNAQCEALMRELAALHQQHESDLGRVMHDDEKTAPTNYPVQVFDGESDSSSPENGHKREHQMEVQSHDSPSVKRQKKEEQPDSHTALHQASLSRSILLEKKIMHHVASFLDPMSLLRCLSVSKDFKGLGVFTDEQIWQDVCASRFGFFNVRQWHAKLDDEEEGFKAPSTTLYRSMDRANVMPTFSHEGMFLLGEVRLPNKVSAWSFLVERSNGETLRSIRRRSDMPGLGDYTSLPVVEIRTIIQNTGACNDVIAIRDQVLTVDASTRRRGEEMKEVDWDERFRKRLERLDGTPYVERKHYTHHPNRARNLAHLRLYESVVLVSFIYARGCSTNSKFVQRSNFSKVLVGLNTGVTIPLVIPFPRDASHLQH